MRERDILVSDVEEAIYSSQREEWKDRARSDAGWRYALRGMNLEGDKDLRIVVAFDGPMAVVVTVIDKNKGSDHE